MNTGKVPEGPCFVAGTLVHTKRGTVPIEQIRVGDLVLARGAADPTPIFKSVTRTIVHEDSPVLLVVLFPEGENDQHFLVCTIGTALLQTRGHGFMRVNDPDMFRAPDLTSLVGEYACAYGAWPLLQTGTPGVAWTNTDDQDYFGPTIDMRNGHIEGSDFFAGSQPEEALGEAFLTTVHGIEVSRHDWWFVGELGICVAHV